MRAFSIGYSIPANRTTNCIAFLEKNAENVANYWLILVKRSNNVANSRFVLLNWQKKAINLGYLLEDCAENVANSCSDVIKYATKEMSENQQKKSTTPIGKFDFSLGNCAENVANSYDEFVKGDIMPRPLAAPEERGCPAGMLKNSPKRRDARFSTPTLLARHAVRWRPIVFTPRFVDYGAAN